MVKSILLSSEVDVSWTKGATTDSRTLSLAFTRFVPWLKFLNFSQVVVITQLTCKNADARTPLQGNWPHCFSSGQHRPNLQIALTMPKMHIFPQVSKHANTSSTSMPTGRRVCSSPEGEPVLPIGQSSQRLLLPITGVKDLCSAEQSKTSGDKLSSHESK